MTKKLILILCFSALTISNLISQNLEGKWTLLSVSINDNNLNERLIKTKKDNIVLILKSDRKYIKKYYSYNISDKNIADKIDLNLSYNLIDNELKVSYIDENGNQKLIKKKKKIVERGHYQFNEIDSSIKFMYNSNEYIEKIKIDEDFIILTAKDNEFSYPVLFNRKYIK